MICSFAMLRNHEPCKLSWKCVCNSFLHGVESALVEYREGLICKVAYWPLLLGLQLLATVFAFY